MPKALEIPISVRVALLEQAKTLAGSIDGNPLGACTSRCCAGVRLAALGAVKLERVAGVAIAVVSPLPGGGLKSYRIEKGKPCQCEGVKDSPGGICKHVYAARAAALTAQAKLKAVAP